MAEDMGFWERTFNNPWATGGMALGAGLLAGATPGTARIVQGAMPFLRMGVAAEQEKKKRLQDQRVSEALRNLGSATEPMEVEKVGFDPNKTTFSEIGDRRLSEVMGADMLAPPKKLPTHRATEERPMFTPKQREYLEAVGSIDPKAALSAIGQNLFRTQQPKSLQRFSNDLGNEIETGVFDPATGQVSNVQRLPKTKEPQSRLVTTVDEQGRPVQRLMTDAEIRQQGDIPRTEAQPPALTESMAIAIEGKVNRGVPLNKREMDALGIDDPAQARAVVQEMRRIKKEGQMDTRTAIAEALAGIRRMDLDAKPMQGMVLDKESGEPVNITQGDYARSPESYVRLTPGQERTKGGLDTAKTHMVVTSEFISALPKSGIRVTNALGQKISQLQNNPDAVALFQQLHSMTSLAVGSALVSGGGGRPGVRLAEFMAPAGVTEGDTLAVAVKKMQTWMNVVTRNAKEAGLPMKPYDDAVNEMNRNIIRQLVSDANGDVNRAKQVAKQYGLKF